ncbi:MAG: putative 4-mercaptohistidine N1-methyltransferase [Opitutales bacterium]
MPENPYETDKLLAEYLLFHYGTPDEVLPWPSGPSEALDFAVRSVTRTLDASVLPNNARALDIGCAVGRASFELAQHCEAVIGIDFSARFIEAASTIARDGRLSYRRPLHAHQFAQSIAALPSGIQRSRCAFEVGDACNLRADLGTFDVVLAANLICRLPEPLRFFDRVPTLLKPDGQFILTSPYTYLEDYTDPAQWLGGLPGGPTPTEAVAEVLRQHGLQRLREVDLPMLIAETPRKFQWTMVHASVWTLESA